MALVGVKDKQSSFFCGVECRDKYTHTADSEKGYAELIQPYLETIFEWD